MEGAELMNGGTSNGYGDGVMCGNGFEKVCNGNGLKQVYSETGSGGVVVSENVNGDLAEEVLEGFEEYWDDISDRLMISRMVSDSVIKGMVTAVEQDCAKRIAAKELEVSTLRESFLSHGVGTSKHEDVNSPVWMKHEKIRGDLNALRNSTRDQFKKHEWLSR